MPKGSGVWSSDSQFGSENLGHLWKSERSMAPGSSPSLIRSDSTSMWGPSPIQREICESKLQYIIICQQSIYLSSMDSY